MHDIAPTETMTVLDEKDVHRLPNNYWRAALPPQAADVAAPPPPEAPARRAKSLALPADVAAAMIVSDLERETEKPPPAKRKPLELHARVARAPRNATPQRSAQPLPPPQRTDGRPVRESDPGRDEAARIGVSRPRPRQVFPPLPSIFDPQVQSARPPVPVFDLQVEPVPPCYDTARRQEFAQRLRPGTVEKPVRIARRRSWWLEWTVGGMVAVALIAARCMVSDDAVPPAPAPSAPIAAVTAVAPAPRAEDPLAALNDGGYVVVDANARTITSDNIVLGASGSSLEDVEKSARELSAQEHRPFLLMGRRNGRLTLIEHINPGDVEATATLDQLTNELGLDPRPWPYNSAAHLSTANARTAMTRLGDFVRSHADTTAAGTALERLRQVCYQGLHDPGKFRVFVLNLVDESLQRDPHHLPLLVLQVKPLLEEAANQELYQHVQRYYRG